MSEHKDRYIPADVNAGWPIAFGVILLAALCITAVAMIHNRTYKPPTDVSWEATDK